MVTSYHYRLFILGKRKDLYQTSLFPDGFCLVYNQKHWSNETEKIRLIEDVLVPYIEEVKEEKFLPPSQKSLLLWDAFKAQSTPKVMDILSSYGIESVMVPRNMTWT